MLQRAPEHYFTALVEALGLKRIYCADLALARRALGCPLGLTIAMSEKGVARWKNSQLKLSYKQPLENMGPNYNTLTGNSRCPSC